MPVQMALVRGGFTCGQCVEVGKSGSILPRSNIHTAGKRNRLVCMDHFNIVCRQQFLHHRVNPCHHPDGLAHLLKRNKCKRLAASVLDVNSGQNPKGNDDAAARLHAVLMRVRPLVFSLPSSLLLHEVTASVTLQNSEGDAIAAAVPKSSSHRSNNMVLNRECLPAPGHHMHL